MWESILATLIQAVGIPEILAKIGGTKVLDWAVATLDFVGKTFLAEIRARRVYNPDLKAFLQQRIVKEEADHPDVSGIQRLENIVKDPATWEFIKALGIEELKDLKGSLLATLISTYHYEMETVLKDVKAVWLATGDMPSSEAITQMVKQRSERAESPAAA